MPEPSTQKWKLCSTAVNHDRMGLQTTPIQTHPFHLACENCTLWGSMRRTCHLCVVLYGAPVMLRKFRCDQIRKSRCAGKEAAIQLSASKNYFSIQNVRVVATQATNNSRLCSRRLLLFQIWDPKTLWKSLSHFHSINVNVLWIRFTLLNSNNNPKISFGAFHTVAGCPRGGWRRNKRRKRHLLQKHVILDDDFNGTVTASQPGLGKKH